MSSDYPLTQTEFNEVYSKVPRLTVEVLLHNDATGVFFTLRGIEPYKGTWHLPGGTVYLGETLVETVKRVAKQEVGIDVSKCHTVGYIEYPSHFKDGHGYPVGIVFLVDEFTGTPHAASEAEKAEWFKKVPDNIHPSQDTFLLKEGYLEAS